jgi:hypothetical protein
MACMTLAACIPAPAGRTSPGPPATSPRPTTIEQPSVEPSAAPTGSPSFVRPTPGPSPTFLAYEVRAGDTLTSIARQFGTTARSIAYWNRSRYPSLDPDSPTYQPGLIKVGWLLLLIPTAVVDEDELPELTLEPTPESTPEPTPVT